MDQPEEKSSYPLTIQEKPPTGRKHRTFHWLFPTNHRSYSRCMSYVKIQFHANLIFRKSSIMQRKHIDRAWTKIISKAPTLNPTDNNANMALRFMKENCQGRQCKPGLLRLYATTATFRFRDCSLAFETVLIRKISKDAGKWTIWHQNDATENEAIEDP
jgi:hypothetical protein